MVTLPECSNLLRGRLRKNADLELELVLSRPSRCTFGAFLGKASDGRLYYVKPIYNKRDRFVPITDQIMARAGDLIGAPVSDVATISIGEDLAGERIGRDKTLPLGIAHASLEVEDSHDVSLASKLHRHRDDNVWKHATYFVFHDWCWGNDPQGLMQLRADNRYYCHDLGNFLPRDGSTWSIDRMVADVDQPHEYEEPITGIPIEVADKVAATLEAVERRQLVDVLAGVPVSWPVRNKDLEVVGYFLEQRASAAARRLRRRFHGGG